jgi:prepilin-type N-terminal cleavage/methylation domain-containing protein
MKKIRTQRGFTLIELAVVIAITVILLGFITINLVRSQQGASLTSIAEILLTDLRQQQLKAMIGDTEGRSTSDTYGIHFDANRYVLFHGTYSDSESTNSIVNLEDNVQFNNPNYDVIFSRLSGATSARTIELQDNTNLKFKRIHLNALGVVTQIESL